MSIFKAAFLAVALAVSSLAFTPVQAAYAQGTKIITYDQARLMRDSAGGKDIAQKLQAIGNSMKTELESEGRALDTEGKSVETRVRGLSPEALRADTALVSQYQNFQTKRAVFQQKTQVRQAELQQTEQNAWADYFKTLQSVLQEVANERGAQVVLERNGVAYSAPNLDVTDLVMSKMNARKPSVTVTRARINLPQQPAQTIQ